MWLADGITGRPPSVQARFSRAARSWCRSRIDLARLEVPHAGERAGRDARRQGGREDEARREAADDSRPAPRRTGDVAAHHAEGLGERPLDHGQPLRSTPSRSAMPPPRAP